MFSVNIVTAGLHLYINGVKYSKASKISYTITSTHIERKGIDSLVGFELSPSSYHVTGRIEVYRQHGDGGLEGTGVTAPYTHLPLQKYFSIMVVNALTKQVIFKADDCSVMEQSWDATAKQRVSGHFTFQGLTALNEARYT